MPLRYIHLYRNGSQIESIARIRGSDSKLFHSACQAFLSHLSATLLRIGTPPV
jgi:HPt (histidine-containing phosphotransfer) domain-containing protein